MATKEVAELKKQRATVPEGPQRKAVDDQIQQLEKVITDSQPSTPKP